MIRTFSAIQPSNILHIGNYIGAIKQWLKLSTQSEYKCYFGVADLHSLTSNPIADINRNALETIYQLLACGIDAEKVSLFRQSKIPSILQIYWKLSCAANYNWLNNTSHLQEKMRSLTQAQKNPSLGLFSYPVLMAADILSFKGQLVPVGQDQQQHIEFTRKLVASINALYGREIFEKPKELISAHGKIMSLANFNEKMSKSSANPNATIFLLDPRNVVKEKIQRAKTDSSGSIRNDFENQPEITNMLRIYEAITNISIDDLVAKYKECTSYVSFKEDLSAAMSDFLDPIQERYQKAKNDSRVLDVLEANESKLEKLANETLSEMK